MAYDMMLTFARSNGIEHHETGQMLQGDAAVEYYEKTFGPRPEALPTPPNNDQRVTAEKLYEYVLAKFQESQDIQRLRIFWPYTMGTMDLGPHRFNIVIDPRGIVIATRWG